MTLIIDATPLVALGDPEEPTLEALLKTLQEEDGPLIVPAPVTAEVDYLLGQRFGAAARRAFLSDLAARRYDVACLEPADYPAIVTLDASYADLDLGLADCSIVLLAARYETRRLLSFDERHFRAVAPLQGGAFELLPADL
ncbi:MAG TPA: VapC toxin family PIN domain ribonuclease [Rhizobiales bacterium]|nr:VapC toxin family PIN domain ribonuclease [Hyphomicrobiales bacterium]